MAIDKERRFVVRKAFDTVVLKLMREFPLFVNGSHHPHSILARLESDVLLRSFYMKDMQALDITREEAEEYLHKRLGLYNMLVDSLDDEVPAADLPEAVDQLQQFLIRNLRERSAQRSHSDLPKADYSPHEETDARIKTHRSLLAHIVVTTVRKLFRRISPWV